MKQCVHCDAANFTQCYEIGMEKPCAENEGSCMIEIRKRDGVMESVCMGCKQIKACRANRGNSEKSQDTYKTDLQRKTSGKDSSVAQAPARAHPFADSVATRLIAPKTTIHSHSVSGKRT